MSTAWTTALAEATRAIEQGEVVAAVGEPGSGRVTLLAQALRRARPRDRILSAASPEPRDVEAWLSMWTPELAKDHTAVIVSDVDVLAAWGAQALYDRVATVRAGMPRGADGVIPTLPWAITAEHLEAVPRPLLTLVDRVIEVPPLRERPEDVMILARYVAHSTRVREVAFTAAAEQALTGHPWAGNVDELFRVVHAAALRADVIDTKHLPPDLVRPTAGHLSRIESFERDEILRCLTRRDVTVAEAAKALGMSRATLYRKIAQYRLGDVR